MSADYRSPFEGGPKTTEYHDPDLGPVIDVQTATIGPIARQVIRYGSAAMGVLGAAYAFYRICNAYDPDLWTVVVWLILALLHFVLWEELLEWITRKDTLVRFTVDQFSVRHGDQWEHYDRRHSHRFSLVLHDWADWERLNEEHKRQKAALERQAYRPRYYFAESYFVSFDYFGQRNDLMCVHGKQEAMQILSRFQACDEIMDNYARAGKRAVLTPDADWAPQPGDLPAE